MALSLLVLRAPGEGVGVAAGAVGALALAAHALVYGAVEAQRAFPAWFARVLLVLGSLAVIAGALLEGRAYGVQLGEAGLFVLIIAATHLVMTVLIARAPTLGDEDPL